VVSNFTAEDDVELIMLEEDCIEEEEDFEYGEDCVEYYEDVADVNQLSNGDESKKNECQQCGKCYKSKTSLIHHYNVHLGKTTCPVCNQVFSRRPYMLSHLKLKHSMVQQETTYSNE